MTAKTLKVSPTPSIKEISFSIDNCKLNLDGNPPRTILKLLAEAKSSRLVCFRDGCLRDIKVRNLAKRVLFKMNKHIIEYHTEFEGDGTYFTSKVSGLSALELVAMLLLDESVVPPTLEKVTVEFNYDNPDLTNTTIEYTVTKEDDLIELNNLILTTVRKHYLENVDDLNDSGSGCATYLMASFTTGEVMFNILKQLIHRFDKVETPIMNGGTIITRVLDKDGK